MELVPKNGIRFICLYCLNYKGNYLFFARLSILIKVQVDGLSVLFFSIGC